VRVCILTATFPPYTTGGVGEVAYNLQRFLGDCGIEVSVITSGRDERKDSNVMRIPCGKTLFAPLSPAYYVTRMSKMRFDVINVQEESGMCVAPLLLANRNRTKIVTTLHTSYLQEARALRPLVVDGHTLASPSRSELMTKYLLMPLKFFGAYVDSLVSDRVIAICKQTLSDCLTEFNIPRSKMGLVYNGVDIEKFTPRIEGGSVRDEHALGDKPVILFVGRAEIRKGLFLLLWAMKGVVAELADATLLVVGAHARTESVEALLKHLDIQRNVIFAGNVPVDRLPNYYGACNLVVLPSTYEGLPLIVLEGMASGKPIVASRVGGVPEAVENGTNGILFESEDTAEMTRSILSVLRDQSTGKRMGERGRTIAEQRFAWKIIARQYLREFAALC